jgi:hypothetical protein
LYLFPTFSFAGVWYEIRPQSSSEGYYAKLPIYNSTVEVDGKTFQPACSHRSSKDAKKDGANVVFENVVTNAVVDDDEPLLVELAQKVPFVLLLVFNTVYQ